MIYEATVAGGVEFDGAAAATGLFKPNATGSREDTVRIKSVLFVADGTCATFTLSLVSDDGTREVPWVEETGGATSLVFDAAGFEMPNDAGGVSWGLKFVTTGMSDDAYLRIDYRVASSEGS
jgi:hypothetical protein